MNCFILRAFVLFLAVAVPALRGQVPQLINYQGRVAVNGVNFDGTGQFKFALVDVNGTTTFWRNSNDTSPADGAPDAAVPLTVTKGLYSVLLGDATLPNMQVIPNSVFNNEAVFLRVWFNDGTANGSQLLSPDQRIAAVGYAMMAGNVPDGTITGAKIAAGAVGSTQLAVNAVQTGNIADGAVGSSQIAPGAVGATQLAKPPRSGRIDPAAMQIGFHDIRFTVPFLPAFANAPVVTLAVRSSSPWQSPVWLESSSLGSLTGRVSLTPLAPSVPDALGSVGDHTSLAVIDGYPAICYRDSTNGDLKFVRAANASGTIWGAPLVVDGSAIYSPLATDCNCGYGASLAVVNGNPAISYYDLTNGTLKFARAADSSGTFWESPVTLDYTGSGTGGSDFSTADTSLVLIDGNPAICYYDLTDDDLMFIRANDSSGTTWGPPVTIDGAESVGRYASMAVINGNPAISYFDDTNFDLKFVRASDASGTAWGSPQTLDSGSSWHNGRFGSLAVVNGNPAISYSDNINSDLRFIRASDANGSAWHTPQTLDSDGSVGSYTSLAVFHGIPAICYRDSGNGDLKFIRATDATGITWDSPIILDSDGSVGTYPSMIMVNGNPAVSYHDGTNADLKFLTSVIPPDFTIQWIALEP